ncbi:MAG: CpXC domain-containing protein [Chthonomonadales bacterium]
MTIETKATRRIEFVCPFCKGKSDTVLQLQLDVIADPTIYDRLFAGSLNEIECQKCHEVVPFDYSMVLIDSVKKNTLWLDPQDDPFALKLESIERDREKLYRIVTDSNTLRELASVHRDGLNDGAMLLLKHMVAARVLQDTGNSPALCSYECRAGESADAWLEFVIFASEDAEPEGVTVPYGMYVELVDQLKDSIDKLMPNGEWIDWNDRMAEKLWMSIPRGKV